MAKTVLMTKNDGRLTFDVELPYVFSLLANGKYTITIKRANEKRSIPQNDLMWMWLTCIERETGTPKEDVYMYYCKKFLMKTIQVGNRMERIYNTSSKLNMEQIEHASLPKVTEVDRDYAVRTNKSHKIKTDTGIELTVPSDFFNNTDYI